MLVLVESNLYYEIQYKEVQHMVLEDGGEGMILVLQERGINAYAELIGDKINTYEDFKAQKDCFGRVYRRSLTCLFYYVRCT